MRSVEKVESLENLLQRPTVREAVFYEKLRGLKVKCNLCERHCVIGPTEKGVCKTRLNVDGTLLTLVYGDLSALESRPIEIKPFFHYWPGSSALTFSTWSCNLNCSWCQNHHLSKTEPNPQTAHFFTKEKILNLAFYNGDNGLCGSFQEPTLLTEWTLPLFEEGSKKALYSCYVSNGYMTSDALKRLKQAGTDALKIDVKGNKEVYRKYCGEIDVDKIWRNAREAIKLGFHVEIVNLVVTNVNDDEESLRWLIKQHLKNVGPETPLHFTGYSPAFKFSNPPTQVETLEKAYELAKKEGVHYPYVGNVEGHKFANTYCPKCDEMLIQRFSNTIMKYAITKDNKCAKCSQPIPIRGKRIRKPQPLV